MFLFLRIIEEEKNLNAIDEEYEKIPIVPHKNSSGNTPSIKVKSPSTKLMKNSSPSPANKSPGLNSLKKGSMQGLIPTGSSHFYLH